MFKFKKFSIILMVLFVSACKKEKETTETVASVSRPNIILIIADDMGKDATFGFSEGVVKPNTPNINKIASNGMRFNNLWVSPTCSPTRASIITGKFGYRTGVKWAGDILSGSETVLQKYINEQTNNAYATAIIGKWHLSGNNPKINPETFGIDYYSGIASGAVADYYDWLKTEDGETKKVSEYATTHLTNLAIDWVSKQDKPWFLWLAYNAPHTPYHVPPANMHSQGALPDYSAGMKEMPYYMAAIEAMDYQIGKLLESIPADKLDNTIIIFIGDNGTPNQVAQFPYTSRTVKGTLYQGGINTPMFISGKGVNRKGEDDNLISGPDLFSTIASLAGVTQANIYDGNSFAELFTSASKIKYYQYSEMNDGTTDQWAIRNENYKLMIDAKGNEEMYDLIKDPYESANILLRSLSPNEELEKDALEAKLLEIRK